MVAEAEWEVVDDDGFIYKRRKKKAVVSSPATITENQDLSGKVQLRINEALSQRKKKAMLLAQKKMYAAEIADWENILKRQEDAMACSPIFQSPSSPEQVTVHNVEDAVSNDDLQVLHLHVEAYEGFREQLICLSDLGESVCKKLEKEVEASRMHVEQDLFREVVKFTPRTIIHSLTTAD